jgi:hypothetical protein
MGETTEHQIVSGTAIPSDEGKVRIALRGQVRWLYLCETCSNWVDQALKTLRQAHTG